MAEILKETWLMYGVHRLSRDYDLVRWKPPKIDHCVVGGQRPVYESYFVLDFSHGIITLLHTLLHTLTSLVYPSFPARDISRICAEYGVRFTKKSPGFYFKLQPSSLNDSPPRAQRVFRILKKAQILSRKGNVQGLPSTHTTIAK